MKWILICFAVSAGAVVDFGVVSPNDDTLYLDKEDHAARLNYTSNWINIVNFVALRGDECPGQWEKIPLFGRSMCYSTNSHRCSSYIYNNQGIHFNEIIGMVVGYQKGFTTAFSTWHSQGINDAYVDGVSITIGSPRKHVWTYAAGLTKEGDYPDSNCPCSYIPGPSPPIFVRDHYYCSSGATTQASSTSYYGPLWKGSGCSVTDNCCTDVGLPWFYRRLPDIENGDIEVRICNYQQFSEESVIIDKLLLAVRMAP